MPTPAFPPASPFRGSPTALVLCTIASAHAATHALEYVTDEPDDQRVRFAGWHLAQAVALVRLDLLGAEGVTRLWRNLKREEDQLHDLLSVEPPARDALAATGRRLGNMLLVTRRRMTAFGAPSAGAAAADAERRPPSPRGPRLLK